MKKYSCQSSRYMILCALIGFTVALPISVENSEEEQLRPTTTIATIEHALPDTQLTELQQPSIVQDFNTLLIFEPIREEAIPFELNERVRRALSQAELNEPADLDDDMELAEVNVFRPLFRYRAEVARRGQRNVG